MQLLDQDLPRTLPQYQFLQTDGYLRDVLQTFVRYRPDIGYVQGACTIAFTVSPRALAFTVSPPLAAWRRHVLPCCDVDVIYG